MPLGRQDVQAAAQALVLGRALAQEQELRGQGQKREPGRVPGPQPRAAMVAAAAHSHP